MNVRSRAQLFVCLLVCGCGWFVLSFVIWLVGNSLAPALVWLFVWLVGCLFVCSIACSRSCFRACVFVFVL